MTDGQGVGDAGDCGQGRRDWGPQEAAGGAREPADRGKGQSQEHQGVVRGDGWGEWSRVRECVQGRIKYGRGMTYTYMYLKISGGPGAGDCEQGRRDRGPQAAAGGAREPADRGKGQS